jgi:hypothetical protein
LRDFKNTPFRPLSVFKLFVLQAKKHKMEYYIYIYCMKLPQNAEDVMNVKYVEILFKT